MTEDRNFLYAQSRPAHDGPGARRVSRAVEHRDPARDALLLRRSLRAAETGSLDEGEFVRRVRSTGTALEPRRDLRGSITGYTVRWRDPRTQRLGPAATDNDLGADVQLSELRHSWTAAGPQAQVAAIAEWYGPSVPVVPTRDTVPLTDPKGWIRALNDAYNFQRTLLEYRADEVWAWRWAAARVAGVLSIWSQRTEFDQPGPLTYSAEELSRFTGALGTRQRPTRPAPASNLAHVAHVLGHLGAADPMVEGLLHGQLVAAVVAIGRAFRDRGNTASAYAVNAGVIVPLTVLRHTKHAHAYPQNLAQGNGR